MLQELSDTNPAQIWVAHKFQLVLSSEDMPDIGVIQFDLSSRDKPDPLDALHIDKVFGPNLLAQARQEMTLDNYAGLCCQVAERLNGEIQETLILVQEQITASFFILVAIRDGLIYQALDKLAWLNKTLQTFSPVADEIWSEWIDKICEYTQMLIDNG
jgi:hypothetical protein